jgi:hypothetical protein
MMGLSSGLEERLWGDAANLRGLENGNEAWKSALCV